MLLRALTEYADSDLSEDLADDAFEEKLVPYSVEIDDQGRFLGVIPRFEEKVVVSGKKTKTIRTEQSLVIPKSPVNRNSGVYPLLGVDSIQYVVGPEPAVWTKPGEQNKHEKHHAGFVELIREVAGKTGDPWLKAACRFYDDPDKVAKAREALAAEKPRGGVNVVLSFRPGLDSEDPGGPIITRRSAVKDYWRRHYHEQSVSRHAKGGEGICMISGKYGPIAVTHDKIKGAAGLGGQPAGVSLMSFDKQAFCSYGWEKNQNGPICPERATAYVLALNDLMRYGRHRPGRDRDRLVRTRTDLGGMGFLYWTRDREDFDVMEFIDFGPGPDADMIVADMLDAPLYGKAVDGVNPNRFYLLTVSGNGGRLVVHDWHDDSLPNIQQNIRAWRKSLIIPDVFHHGEPAPVPSVYRLLHAIMTPAMKDDHKRVGHWKLAMVRRALFGARFPLGLEILAAALDRLRNAKGNERLSSARAGLIRLCTHDLIGMKKEGETALNENHPTDLDHPAAICGRLMALYEGLQYQAHKKRNRGDSENKDKGKDSGVGSNVVDRYFALASTYPRLAFLRLEIHSKSHLKKLRRDDFPAYVAINRYIDELHEKLVSNGANYPAQLSIEDQGRFAIAYHWQHAEDARRIREAKDRKAAENAETETEA